MREIEKKLFEQRRIVAIAFVLLFFSILIFGFVRLQVNKKDFYTKKSIDNSVRKINTLPVRGLIKDNKGRILVDNHAAFSIAVIPKVVADSTLQKIDSIFNIGLSTIKETIAKEYGFRPVKITRDIAYNDIITLEENRLQFPGVIVALEPKRYYHEGVYSPHLFGSLGEVSVEEQKQTKNYEQGDIVGKTALEKQYDLDLRGSKGAEYIRVDASGRELGDYNSELNVEAIHGNDLNLYLDYSMQQFAESLMVDKRGSLVALDTRNGGILALVSKPDYDPRYLAGKIDPDLWNELLSDESHPLYSRSIQSVYPPGSTYKIVAAIAALEEKIVSPSWKVTCPGYFRLGRKIIHCWKEGGHGTVGMYDAIKGSCNVYFYNLGLKIGLNVWSKYSKMFGFGKKTGIDLPNESNGLVPTESFFNSRYGKNGWTKGNLANLAIGQGELLVTPLQLAQFVMIIANKGIYYKPHVLKNSFNPSTEEEIIPPHDPQYVKDISDKSYDVIREGMRQVMDGGTGWFGKVPGIEMAGKTGTAQNPHGDSHAWFMAFAPYDQPEIAVSVIIENGGGGGAVAAPLARKFLEMHFFGRLIPRPVAKKVAQPIDNIIAPLNMESFEPIEIIETEESIQGDN